MCLRCIRVENNSAPSSRWLFNQTSDGSISTFFFFFFRSSLSLSLSLFVVVFAVVPPPNFPALSPKVRWMSLFNHSILIATTGRHQNDDDDDDDSYLPIESFFLFLFLFFFADSFDSWIRRFQFTVGFLFFLFFLFVSAKKKRKNRENNEPQSSSLDRSPFSVFCCRPHTHTHTHTHI